MSLPENQSSSTEPSAIDTNALQSMRITRDAKRLALPTPPRIAPVPDRDQYKKALRNARVFFLMLGVFAIGFGVYSLSNLEKRIDEHITRQIREHQASDPSYFVPEEELAAYKSGQLEKLRFKCQISLGLGTMYFVLAVALRRFPISALAIGTGAYLIMQIANLVEMKFQFAAGHLISLLILMGLLSSLTIVTAARRASREPTIA